MKHRATVLLIACVLALGPGCHTIQQMTTHGQGPAVFGGLRLFGTTFKLKDAPFSLLFLLDVPFSFAADLVLLPVSIPWEIHEGGIKVSLFPKGVIPH